MHLRKETIAIQEVLGAYCRDGREVSIPGIREDRLHHYRRLVNNVVRDNLDAAFPITVAALEEEEWDHLVQEFFARGRPKSPKIWQLPFEFYMYHSRCDSGVQTGLPYLNDLLYFEWMEIQVYNMPERSRPAYASRGDLIRDRLVFNPDHEIIRLEYPVHLFPAHESPDHMGDYFILIYRVPDTGYVHFLNLSSVNIYILHRLEEDHVPAGALLDDIARSTGIESGRYLLESLAAFLNDLMEKQVILGFKQQ